MSGLTRGLMQNFGERGLHPRAFASCQDDDVEVWRTELGRHCLGPGSAASLDATSKGSVRRVERLMKRFELVENSQVWIL